MARITAFDICALLIAVQMSSPARASFRSAAGYTVATAALYTTVTYEHFKKVYQASPYTTYGASSAIGELLSCKYDACNPQFAEWARKTLKANDKNGDDLEPFIFVVAPNADCQMIDPPFFPAGRIIVVPESMEKETLELLNTSSDIYNQKLQEQAYILEHEYGVVLLNSSSRYTCNDIYNQKLQGLTAILDHEYGHVKQRLLGERLGAVFALSCVPLPPGLNVLSLPFALYVMTALIRSQERRADENIRNNVRTLRAFQTFMEEELCSPAAKQVNPYSSLQNLLFAAEVADGTWYTPLIATHPPANQRIARLQERIDALEVDPEQPE